MTKKYIVWSTQNGKLSDIVDRENAANVIMDYYHGQTKYYYSTFQGGWRLCAKNKFEKEFHETVAWRGTEDPLENIIHKFPTLIIRDSDLWGCKVSFAENFERDMYQYKKSIKTDNRIKNDIYLMSPYDFDQTIRGWRSIPNIDDQIHTIKKYLRRHSHKSGTCLDYYKNIGLINFHLGQLYAFRSNNYPEASYYMNSSFDYYDDEWNDYINCTIAFFKRDRSRFDSFYKKNNYNVETLNRLRDNFDTSYKLAYLSE